MLIKKRENAGLKHLNDSKSFVEYLNDMDDICRNFGEYIPNKKLKISVVFDDMIADMFSYKRRKPIVTEFFIGARRLNIYLVSITQYYFVVPKNIRLHSAHYSYYENAK